MKFTYTVQDSQGNTSTGVMESGDEEQAVLELQNKGYFILSIRSQKQARKIAGLGKLKGGRIGGYDLAFFAEQLATLLKGGIPLVRSLSLLGDHAENRALGKVISEITKDVSSGGAFYKALSKHSKVFDNIWVSLVQAGEMGGQLPNALHQISAYIQSKESIKSKIITALSYPAILMAVAIGVLSYFIVAVVPTFAGVFSDFNMKLPFLTQIIVDISTVVSQNFILLIVVIIAALVAFRVYITSEVGRFNYNKFMMKIPIFGDFIRNVQFERLLTTMSTLVRSGVSILNTITVLESAFSENLVIRRALKAVRQDVAAGKSISTAFKNTGVFPGLVTEMMWMGEESGKLPDIIGTLSKFYTERINQFLARFSSLVDPILILFVGGIIGVVVIALFLPIFKLSQIGVFSS